MKRLSVLILLAFCGPKPAYAFNLIQDFKDNLKWTIGDQVSLGTAIRLTDGGLRYTALFGFNEYRMFSTWYGPLGEKDSNGNLVNIQDCFKLGVNIGYFLTGFANKPPDIISKLVIGPGVETAVFSNLNGRTPVVPVIDFNIRFGGNS